MTYVVKTSGLSSGKGVLVTPEWDVAAQNIQAILAGGGRAEIELLETQLHDAGLDTPPQVPVPGG